MKDKPDFSRLKAQYVNCTLKDSSKKSHTEGLMNVSMDIMKAEGVSVDYLRLADHVIPVGLQPDMTDEGVSRDDWPRVFEKIKQADILVVGTPIWLGEKSSIATKLVERLYGMSAQTNEKGQYLYYGKVGGCIITGNEDGIKHCAMGILYALQHLGFSIPPQADCGWIGEAGPGPSYLDEESGAKNNEFTNRNTTFMTYNLLHLAKMLKEAEGFPSYGNSRDAWDDGTRWNFENPEYR
ncbi:flavodoxin family protein [Flavobacteriaceae bacterium TP-CH-4]|uniref:Flavodoxin family protein n=1 Tax=Pelagihabitans pacificus TaxID=2696054 RepID=A0A967AW37_9FLAO|nr:NAD(P)H-dependent oxidoreductase [Pelagihabitans pacificus]NHF61012.1 flavodoxin family protein [Pelagihabitans pacificus]